MDPIASSVVAEFDLPEGADLAQLTEDTAGVAGLTGLAIAADGRLLAIFSPQATTDSVSAFREIARKYRPRPRVDPKAALLGRIDGAKTMADLAAILREIVQNG